MSRTYSELLDYWSGIIGDGDVPDFDDQADAFLARVLSQQETFADAYTTYFNTVVGTALHNQVIADLQSQIDNMTAQVAYAQGIADFLTAQNADLQAQLDAGVTTEDVPAQIIAERAAFQNNVTPHYVIPLALLFEGGTTDVSTAFNAWHSTIPNGTASHPVNVHLGPGATYWMQQGLLLDTKSHRVYWGHLSTVWVKKDVVGAISSPNTFSLTTTNGSRNVTGTGLTALSLGGKTVDPVDLVLSGTGLGSVISGSTVTSPNWIDLVTDATHARLKNAATATGTVTVTAHTKTSRRVVNLTKCTDIVLDSLIMKGPNPSSGNGSYDPGWEASHALADFGSLDCTAQFCEFRECRGDGVYLGEVKTTGPSGNRAGYVWSRGFHLLGGRIEKTGRMGIGVVNGQDFVMEGLSEGSPLIITNTGRSSVDNEANGAQQRVLNGTYRNIRETNVGLSVCAGSGIYEESDMLFQNIVVVDSPWDGQVSKPTNGRRTNWTFRGCRSLITTGDLGGSTGSFLPIYNIDGVVFEDCEHTFNGASTMHFAKCIDCTGVVIVDKLKMHRTGTGPVPHDVLLVDTGAGTSVSVDGPYPSAPPPPSTTFHGFWADPAVVDPPGLGSVAAAKEFERDIGFATGQHADSFHCYPAGTTRIDPMAFSGFANFVNDGSWGSIFFAMITTKGTLVSAASILSGAQDGNLATMFANLQDIVDAGTNLWMTIDAEPTIGYNGSNPSAGRVPPATFKNVWAYIVSRARIACPGVRWAPCLNSTSGNTNDVMNARLHDYLDGISTSHMDAIGVDMYLAAGQKWSTNAETIAVAQYADGRNLPMMIPELGFADAETTPAHRTSTINGYNDLATWAPTVNLIMWQHFQGTGTVSGTDLHDATAGGTLERLGVAMRA